MIKYIIFLLCIKKYHLLFTNDIFYEDKLPQGKVVEELSINEIDVEKANCDTTLMFDFPACDLKVYHRSCIFERWIEDYDMHGIISRLEPSFKIEIDKNQIVDTSREYLRCDVVREFKCPANENKCNPKLVFKKWFPYQDYFHLTTEFGDLLFGRSSDYSMAYYTLLRRINIIKIGLGYFIDDFYEYYNFVIFGVLHLYYALRFKCLSNYYGSKCWFECTSDIKRICNCTQVPYPSKVECEITCRPPYIGRKVSYLIDDYREIVILCDMIDPCKSSSCSKDTICLAVSNKSYYCVAKPYYIITSNIMDSNITSFVWYYSELMNVELDKENLDKYLNTTSFLSEIYINVNDNHLYYDKILQFNTSHQFKVIGEKYDYFFTIFIEIYLGPWDITVIRSRHFIIFVQPYSIFLAHAKDDKKIYLYVLLNETIYCNSTARPNYRAVYFWQSIMTPMYSFFGQYKTINVSTQLGTDTLNVTNVLIVPERPNEINNVSKQVQIKLYSYFGWSENLDVLKNGVNLTCSVDMYVEYELYIQQMEGTTLVNTTDKTYVLLDNFTGGHYSFVCILIAVNRTLIFSKIIEFILIRDPSFTCIYMFPSSPGTLIQCGHDGNFYDNYEIRMRVYFLEHHNLTLKSAGDNHVKLPYVVYSNTYFIECVISSIFTHKVFVNSTDGFTFAEGLTQFIKKDDRNQICSNFYPYIQYPPIISSTYEYVEVLIYGIELQIHESNENVRIATRFLTIVTLPVFLIIWMMIFYEENKKTTTETRFFISHMHRTLIRGMINNRLNDEVKHAMDTKSASVAKFYRASFFDKFNETKGTLSTI